MFSLDRQTAPDPHDLLPPVPSFSLESSDVADGETVDPKFTHPSVGGGNVSPQLTWSGFPSETRGFAVTCFDPDAPTGSGFWHWAVINVSVSTTNLAQGASGTDAMPDGAVEGRNDFGSYGWGGCAPPAGDRPHRYVFTVHALDLDHLDLDADTPLGQIGFNLTFHTIAKATMRPIFQV